MSAKVTRGPARQRRGFWIRVFREAALLFATAVVLAGLAWAVRQPRLPLRADAAYYDQELPAPLVSLDEALRLYAAGQHLFVDTRPLADRRVPHIPGAFFIREQSFADDLYAVGDFLFPEDPLILYGDGDLQQVATVASRFLDRGYENLSILAAGVAAWQRAGGPLTDPREGTDD